MKLLRLAVLAAALAGVAAYAGVGRPDLAGGAGSAARAARTITVTGNGSVDATPSRAVFSFGVSTQGTTASAALGANAVAATKVIAALKDAGVGAADIQTESISLSPVVSDKGDAIVAYLASSSVSVTISAIDRSGAVVDAAVRAGANQVSGPALTVSDQDALYRKALTQAVADARTKAQALAQASSLELGAVVSVAEGAGAAPAPVLAPARQAVGAVPVEPGRQEIDASVTVVFAVS